MGDACCPLGPGPRQESPWGYFRGTCHSVGWGHCGSVPSCHRVGVAGGHGGVWGWWSGHLEGPGGGLPLRGHGAGLMGENLREPLRTLGPGDKLGGHGGVQGRAGPGAGEEPYGRPLISAQGASGPPSALL